MAVKKVWIEEGCIVCHACEDICQEVFEVTDETCVVRSDADPSQHEEGVREAADTCPVEVIRFEEDGG